MKQALIAFDQLLNVWLFWWLPGGTWADETLSARAWRIRHEWPRLHLVIDAAFFFDHDHCRTSYESEQQRMQAPPEVRTLSR